MPVGVSNAAFICSNDKAKLVSFSNCSQIGVFMTEVRQGIRSSNLSFWIGMFVPGEALSNTSSRNWFGEPVVDS